MKKQIEKKLEKIGYRLVSTKFGIYGDWAVVDTKGNSFPFITLGSVRRWVDRQPA